MQQRRLRLGDILDDYCPRERRITNHAVVAMIEDEVRQTRCTTCDAEHEYKQARVPARRKKEAGTLVSKGTAAAPKPRAAAPLPAEVADAVHDEIESVDEFPDTALSPAAEADIEPAALAASDTPAPDAHTDEEPITDASANEDEPVHRPLIRATLPRPEGQPQDWKNPDFTVRHPGGGRGSGGFEGNRNGHRPADRGGRRTQRAQGNPQPGQPTRFGGQRPGSSRHGSGQPHGQGNRSGSGRPGHASGHGQGQGQHRGQRHGGHGRKRGR
jgi:hypothetical protein